MKNLKLELSAATFALTPERALIVLPAVGGVVAALLLIGAALIPLSAQIKAQKQKFRDYQIQDSALPDMSRDRVQQLQRRDQALAQEERLLSLVSDVTQLDTLLMSLSSLASESRIHILSVEPQNTQDGDKKAASAATSQKSTKSDPRFVMLTYLMVAQGSFPSLLEFLRRVETLNTAVLISDLEIKAVADSDSTAQKSVQPQLKFRLTAYQRKPSKSD